jgi:hypothetical protein
VFIVGLADKFGDLLVRIEDWSLEGTPLVSSLKFGGLVLTGICAVTGILYAPTAYATMQNGKEIAEAMARIDKAPIHSIFTSQAACTEMFSAEDCSNSYKKAVELSETLGSGIRYENEAKCLENHGTCEETVSQLPYKSTVNGVSITTILESRIYSPVVAAWQAAGEKLEVSVPLYRGAQENVLVRKDGQSFAMTPQ